MKKLRKKLNEIDKETQGSYDVSLNLFGQFSFKSVEILLNYICIILWRRYTIFVTRRNYVALLSLIRIEIRLSNYTQSCTQPPVSSALCHFVIAVVAIPCNCSTCFEIAIKLTISTIIRCHGLSNVYFYSPPFACTSFRLVAGQRIENRNIKRTRRSIHATDTLPRSSMFIKCVVASRCLNFPLIFSTIDILVVFIFFFFFSKK